MERLGTWVTRHRLIVGLLWLVITAVGVVIAPSLSGRLQSGVHVSGPGYAANAAIAAHYGGAASDPGVLILNAPTGQNVDTPAVKADLGRVDATLAKSAPNLRIVSAIAVRICGGSACSDDWMFEANRASHRTARLTRNIMVSVPWFLASAALRA